MPYIGRFAPSPTGALHAGSLVAAMASYLDARAHQGQWLLRIEDLDPPREVAGASAQIVQTLAAFGFQWHGPVTYQSQRTAAYQRSFERLSEQGHVYPCACSRKEAGDGAYPGLCRFGMPPGKSARAFRLRCNAEPIAWQDRNGQRYCERVDQMPGDFVLKRADGFWAYQLAVVVDDGLQGVTHVVRGDDLADSTARQIYLQNRLALPTPSYLHVPVVKAADGQKLSKQTGATALAPEFALRQLASAATHLALGTIDAGHLSDFWAQATTAWAQRHTVH